MEKQEAQSLLEQVVGIPCYYTRVLTAPSVGALSNLHTTIQLQNAGETDLLSLFDVTVGKLCGQTTDRRVQGAVARLNTVLKSKLIEPLDDSLRKHIGKEKPKMVAIMIHLLLPLIGKVVANQREYAHYAEIVVKDDASWVYENL